MTHNKTSRLGPEQYGGRGRSSGGEDLNRVLERFGARPVGEQVENDWCAAHVGHAVDSDRLVDDTSVEFAQTDVGTAHCCHSPGEAPTIRVEHGQGPQVHRLLRHTPIDQRINGDDEDSPVAVDHALWRRRRSRCVIENHWVPLTLRSYPLELRISPPDHILVSAEEINGGGWRVLIIGDENEKGALKARRE